jgi:hypothetical protein
VLRGSGEGGGGRRKLHGDLISEIIIWVASIWTIFSWVD